MKAKSTRTQVIENFTFVENEYNRLFAEEVTQMNTRQMSQEQRNGRLRWKSGEILLRMRLKRMDRLKEVTGRNIICYASGWLQIPVSNPTLLIGDEDMIGLMNAVSGMRDRERGLDLILHTPGGGIAATESLVNYLRKMFNMDIRVIVPHMAMSAGTMIACSSKEIIMGKQSSLGPIDPQLQGVPAEGIIEEFKRAIQETQETPNRALIWREIINQYTPTFVGECQKALNMSRHLVRGWLEDCMLKDEIRKKDRSKRIIKNLASHNASKAHNRHYDCTKCQELGLKVSPLEQDQDLQERVLSLYHCYVLSFSRFPEVIKYIESIEGQFAFQAQ